MKNRVLTLIAVIILLPFSTGCAPAMFTGMLVGHNLASKEIVKFMGGDVVFEDVTVEKKRAGDLDHGMIVVRGHFKYSPAKIRGQEFIAISSYGGAENEMAFSFRLEDTDGDRLIQLQGIGTITDESIDLDAVPANRLVPFEITHEIPRNLWDQTATVEFDNVYGLPGGPLPPAYIAQTYTGR